MIKSLLYLIRKRTNAFFRIFYIQKIPKYQLEEIHIKNCKVIKDRSTMLTLIPSGGNVAEIGVDEGNFSQKIIDINKPTKLHLIDTWNTKRYNKKDLVFNKFKEGIRNNKIEINEGVSYTIAEIFKNNYFDWIYIDTDHSYKTTFRELIAFKNKVKPRGIIAGHDFVEGNWDKDYRYGVIEAVSKFCVLENWELVYLTIDKVERPSFAIRRINCNSQT